MGQRIKWQPGRRFRDLPPSRSRHGDGLSLSIGVGGEGITEARSLGEDRDFVPRNAPEIYNRGALGWDSMFWDRRVVSTLDGEFISPAGPSLPDGLHNVVAVQAMFPVTSRDEMRGSPGDKDSFGNRNELALIPDHQLSEIWAAITDRLLAIPDYVSLFQAAYPDVPVEWLGFQHAANAIAAYEQNTFTFNDSPWDRYLAGDENALSPTALQGARLFYGEAGCSQCHNGSLLTDQMAYNIGVPQLGPGKGDEAPQDLGAGALTGNPADNYAFRTPPLCNVTLTGPWMHNGAYHNLEDAVRHHLDPVTAFENYDATQLVPALQATYQPNPDILANLDPLLDTPIELSDQDIQALMAFLDTLTSPTAEDICQLIPNAVPSGLPIDLDPYFPCLETP